MMLIGYFFPIAVAVFVSERHAGLRGDRLAGILDRHGGTGKIQHAVGTCEAAVGILDRRCRERGGAGKIEVACNSFSLSGPPLGTMLHRHGSLEQHQE